jgi:hypothetical protein
MLIMSNYIENYKYIYIYIEPERNTTTTTTSEIQHIINKSLIQFLRKNIISIT